MFMHLLRLALMVGALAVGQTARADDHGDSLSTATRVAVPSETAGATSERLLVTH